MNLNYTCMPNDKTLFVLIKTNSVTGFGWTPWAPLNDATKTANPDRVNTIWKQTHTHTHAHTHEHAHIYTSA